MKQLLAHLFNHLLYAMTNDHEAFIAVYRDIEGIEPLPSAFQTFSPHGEKAALSETRAKRESV